MLHTGPGLRFSPSIGVLLFLSLMVFTFALALEYFFLSCLVLINYNLMEEDCIFSLFLKECLAQCIHRNGCFADLRRFKWFWSLSG